MILCYRNDNGNEFTYLKMLLKAISFDNRFVLSLFFLELFLRLYLSLKNFIFEIYT